jgi:retron-type reverse transcriptase
MTTTRYEIGYDQNGNLYRYEIDHDGIVIRKNKKLLISKDDSRTRTKQVY